MKICFFLQRRFAYIGHEMAKLLKERYGVTDFCGYVSLRSSLEFLKNQEDIQYTGLVLEEDVYGRYREEKLDPVFLEDFEKKYGIPNLWPYINLDRVIRYNLLLRNYPHDRSAYSHEEMLRIFQVTAKAVTKFLDEEKPDCVIFSVIGNISSLLLYEVAKKRGIKTLILDAARIGNKYFWTEEYDRSTYVWDSFAKIKNSGGDEYGKLREDAEKFLSEYQKKSYYFFEKSAAFSALEKPVNRLPHFRFLLPKNLFKNFSWFFKSLFYFWQYRKDYDSVNPLWENFDKAKRKLRILIGYSGFYDSIKKEDYIFFPLHTEPEAYPMLLAPFYTDQIWLIKQVARSLPATYKLYIKDHPAMLGYRPRSFYKELKKIPNVKLINIGENSLDLIKNSKMVVTLLGTAGWEAVLSKKPVIIFGKIFYDGLSMVRRCAAIEDLPYLVKGQLEQFQYQEKELIDFIAALYKESVDLDLPKLWDVEGGGKLDQRKSELVPLVDLIASKLGFIL